VAELTDADRGPVRQPGPLVRLADSPARIGRSAPRLGDTRPEDIGWTGGTGGPDHAAEPGVPGGPPLAGVTVLELAMLFAAPFGTTLLTDLGARVIKVEPLTGDPIRMMVGFPEAGGAKVMQGKDSICIDLTTPDGVAIVHRLAARADLVLQGYRAGAAERHHVDAETLRALNPGLVYLHAPGYGAGPPNGHRPAFAPSMGAAAGIARANVGASVPERADLTIRRSRRGDRAPARTRGPRARSGRTGDARIDARHRHARHGRPRRHRRRRRLAEGARW
jgi:crotonobetainyl-CoA:carnitine CoA-transferase CaiB-like acyl-CoA transferase